MNELDQARFDRVWRRILPELEPLPPEPPRQQQQPDRREAIRQAARAERQAAAALRELARSSAPKQREFLSRAIREAERTAGALERWR